ARTTRDLQHHNPDHPVTQSRVTAGTAGLRARRPGASGTIRLGMADYLQIPAPQGVSLFVLESDRVTLGKDPSNTVVVDTDPTVSRMHAVLERFPAGWCLRD